VRYVGVDVHREVAEVVVLEDGLARPGGPVPATPEGIRLLADRLAPDGELVLVEREAGRLRAQKPGHAAPDDHPRVDMVVAISLTAAIGDIARFRSSGKLVSNLGLDSCVRQSGSQPARHGRPRPPDDGRDPCRAHRPRMPSGRCAGRHETCQPTARYRRRPGPGVTSGGRLGVAPHSMCIRVSFPRRFRRRHAQWVGGVAPSGRWRPLRGTGGQPGLIALKARAALRSRRRSGR
jgi:hypothetical protein